MEDILLLAVTVLSLAVIIQLVIVFRKPRRQASPDNSALVREEFRTSRAESAAGVPAPAGGGGGCAKGGQ